MGLRVVINGKPVDVPRDVAAAGGAKLDEWIRKQQPKPKVSAKKTEEGDQ